MKPILGGKIYEEKNFSSSARICCSSVLCWLLRQHNKLQHTGWFQLRCWQLCCCLSPIIISRSRRRTSAWRMPLSSVWHKHARCFRGFPVRAVPLQPVCCWATTRRSWHSSLSWWWCLPSWARHCWMEWRWWGYCGRYTGCVAVGRLCGGFCFRLFGLQMDDQYREERQADLFCHLLRDSRCHNAHIKLKSPPCVGGKTDYSGNQ